MQKKDIRLIVMDMDGTLLNSKQKISEKNAQTLRMAAEQGIKLAICSGRAAADVALFVRENQLTDCATLGVNGTNIWLDPNGTEIANHVFKRETLEKTVRILWDANVLFTCFSRNNLAVLRDDEGTKDFIWVSHKGVDLHLYHGPDGLKKIWDVGVNKIIAIFPDEQSIEDTRKKLIDVDGLEISSSWKDNLELMPEGINKGTAVAELAAHLGLDASQVMTFGDFDNDLPMIEWAGWGTAMGNANEKVKKAAKLVTLTNDEDGVAWAVQKYALK